MNTQNALVANNYGRGVFGLYSSTRYQHLWSMGTAYKLPDDGTTTGNLYGVAWSYPSAGGAAANLSDHGMLIINNGLYRAAISNSIRCVTDMRTPIYYDSANTAYYGDFASNSNINTLTSAGTVLIGGVFANNPYNSVTGARLMFGGEGNSNYYIGTNLENYGGNYTKLDIRWHTGIRMGAQPSYGGIRFYDTETLGTEIFAIGKSGNYVQAANSLRAPIFYDSNSTAYYVDPASTSRLNTLNCDGAITSGTSSTGNIYCGNVGSTHMRLHVVGNTSYFDMNSGNISWRQGSSTRYIFYSTTANMTIYGTLTQGSDIRIKENIVEIGDCIDKVKSIRGVYYNRTDFNTEPTKIGVIAQEVEKQMPELVHDEPTTGIKSVSYTELTAVLINAIKEQQVIIDDLKSRIEKLEL